MSNKYDVIVIGGGHNGLVNAAYLARAGKRVLVLERRHVLGIHCYPPGYMVKSHLSPAGVDMELRDPHGPAVGWTTWFPLGGGVSATDFVVPDLLYLDVRRIQAKPGVQHPFRGIPAIRTGSSPGAGADPSRWLARALIAPGVAPYVAMRTRARLRPRT